MVLIGLVLHSLFSDDCTLLQDIQGEAKRKFDIFYSSSVKVTPFSTAKSSSYIKGLNLEY